MNHFELVPTRVVGNATNGHFSSGMFGSYGANGAFIPKYTPDAYLGSAEFFENVAGHALVGCASSAAGGGDCGSGALAAGMSSAAAPKLVTMGFYGGLATSATIGGVSSVAGGGKFWNGAKTATYGYLFNAAMAMYDDHQYHPCRLAMAGMGETDPCGSGGAMGGASGGGEDPIQDLFSGIGRAVQSIVDFIVTPGGTVYPVPNGAVGPAAAENGKGIQFQGGSGGNGLDSRVTGFRYMDPVLSGPYQYPNGYGSYNNATGQTVNPITGRTISPSDPMWHIAPQ